MHYWVAVLVLWGVATGLVAEPLRVGFGTHKPPYLFEGEARGLEYDIVVAAMRSGGFEVEAYYAPMERLHLMLRRADIDCIATTNEQSGVAAYYSDVYLHYHNVAVALASRQYRIDSIEDLAGHSVSAFQRARFLLGPRFQHMAEANPRYREEAQQIARNRLLYTGRIEVIVGDARIIDYFNREVDKQVDIHQPLSRFAIFEPTPYRLGFRFQIQRDLFNRGLAKIRRSGEYEAIERRYAVGELLPQP
ncbi:MAG: transporter substrate-binding domain-containing protein [Pseudomonas sp.]|uniref:substrate-binding periplasmic protein n=1 Tax=Pseudomonas sp. TaxID=306 RepID=UPI0033922CF7